MPLEQPEGRTISPRCWYAPFSIIVAALIPILVFGQSVTVLRLRVLEGEGDVFSTSSRIAQPLVVQVSDETGKPLEGVTVSFALPPEGPGGVFAGNMRTDIAITRADGKAAMSAVEWNGTAGPVSVRITAATEHVRAGLIAALYLSEAPVTPVNRTTRAGGRSQWKKIALIVGAASAAGLAVGWKKGESGAAPAAVEQPAANVQIGSPSVTIGKP